MLLSLCSKSYWSGTRMEVLWKTSLGSNMACGGLAEELLTTRDRILPAVGEDPPMGFVPTPRKCRTHIVLD